MARRRIDRIEIGAFLLFLVVVAILIAANRTPPGFIRPELIEAELIAEMRRRFGAERFSQGPEEYLVRDFFDDRRGGVFLDVGAFDPVRYSNTYRLERDLGWSGVAVDAIAEFAGPYARTRPRSKFFTAFVGDTDEGEATLHVDVEQAVVASGDPSFTARFTGNAVPRQVRRRTIDSILREAGITKLDFVSLDIELGEPAALKAFDLGTYRPNLLCIEAHAESRQAILDAMARAGYVVVGRYLRADEANLYFKPLESPVTARR